ncbi:MAG: hemolysin family protein [Deltaproteobacteria bacterium]|nr:hemolysin family protein [Deltaproteobacteria bacterium]
MEDGPSKRGIFSFLFKPFRKPSLSPTEIEEELSDLLDHGAESGVLTKSQGEMIHSIFEFDDTVARKIMTPRVDVVGVEASQTIGGLIQTALSGGYSRLPIYEEDLDHITGFVMVKDLLGFWSQSLDNPIPKEIIRPILFVHGSKKIAELLSELRHRKSHLAVILDEYGGTAGLVTMEDIIEQIVGDINDEYDLEEEDSIKELTPGVFLAHGQTPISVVNNLVCMNIPQGNYETLGGFLTEQMGRVPQPQEIFPFQEFIFSIKAADNRKVDQVEISKKPKSNGEDHL